MPDDKIIKHRIGHCSICGWVHGTIDRVRAESDGVVTVKSLCKTCQSKMQREVVCSCCGRKSGDNLFPTIVERKRFEIEGGSLPMIFNLKSKESACKLMVMLCAECKMFTQDILLRDLAIPGMCDSCADRFICFTTKEKESKPDRFNTGRKRLLLSDRMKW